MHIQIPTNCSRSDAFGDLGESNPPLIEANLLMLISTLGIERRYYISKRRNVKWRRSKWSATRQS